ncbi:MAG: putative DNA-binding domain-containing protein [Novosphingobium sp.]
MLALERLQTGMMRALDYGPDFLPQGLFAGSPERILAGMKIHANTISHARLVAIEDTFPRTMSLLGQARFNEVSRSYLEQPGVTARCLARIGEDFPGYLASLDEGAATGLARFEWLWLQAYHAADAVALRLAELAGIAPEDLMEIAVQAHPAASIGQFDAAHHLIGLEIPGLDECAAILLTRPEADVLVSPACAGMAAVFSSCENRITIGNLFASASEPGCMVQLPPDDFMPALIALLEAGALQQVA